MPGDSPTDNDDGSGRGEGLVRQVELDHYDNMGRHSKNTTKNFCDTASCFKILFLAINLELNMQSLKSSCKLNTAQEQRREIAKRGSPGEEQEQSRGHRQ